MLVPWPPKILLYTSWLEYLVLQEQFRCRRGSVDQGTWDGGWGDLSCGWRHLKGLTASGVSSPGLRSPGAAAPPRGSAGRALEVSPHRTPFSRPHPAQPPCSGICSVTCGCSDGTTSAFVWEFAAFRDTSLFLVARRSPSTGPGLALKPRPWLPAQHTLGESVFLALPGPPTVLCSFRRSGSP